MAVSEERRDDVFKLLVVCAAVAVQLVAFDKGLQIELKARWAKFKQALRDYTDAESTGFKVAEWWIGEEAPKVIADAERLTKEASE